jgi:hypothetical protein
MAPRQYVEKPRKVQAEQYVAGMALPPGVDDCELFPAGGLHAHTDTGTKAVHETDWFIWDRTGARLTDVLTDAEFTDIFGQSGGPPTVTGEA